MIEKAYIFPCLDQGLGKEPVHIEDKKNLLEALEKACEEISEIGPDTLVLVSDLAPYYEDAFFIGGGKFSQGLFKGSQGQSLVVVDYDQDLSEALTNLDLSLPLYYTEEDADSLDPASLRILACITRLYKDFKLVLIGPSTSTGKTHYRVGQALKETVENLGRKTVLIALSSLANHDEEEDLSKDFDKKIINILENSAFDELLNIEPELEEDLTDYGLNSIRVLAGAMDSRDVKGQVLSYFQDQEKSYCLASFEPGEKNEARSFLRVKEPSHPYARLAKEAIEKFVRDKEVIDPPKNLDPVLFDKKSGVFVSLYKFDDLRGCIGTSLPTKDSLAEEIIKNAITAASDDPRFYEVLPSELPYLEIAVDLLDEPLEIESLDRQDPENQGLIVEFQDKKSTLMPGIEGLTRPQDQLNLALRQAEIDPADPYKMMTFTCRTYK